MAEKVTNYQCPNCTGPLHYDGGSGKLVCDYCGSSYTPEEIEALYAEKEQKAATAWEQAQASAAQEKESTISDATGGGGTASDTTSQSQEGEQEGTQEASSQGSALHLVTYSCPSCGAELICDETTAATQCPYCGNPTVIPGQFTGTLRPDWVIPFHLQKDDAMKALRQHYEGKFLLPRRFRSENQVQKIQGVYVPFWMFDGSAEGSASYETARTRVYRRGDYEVTETDHFTVQRSGSLTFERIPADASSRMPDDVMDSIEPYDYAGLKPFSTAYLPGFLANKYDVSSKDCSERAHRRAEATLYEELQNTVTGYDTCTRTGGQCQIHESAVHYALLPVWLLSTRWNGKNFLFAMNGQTGRLVGDLPVSWGKFWAMFAILTAALSAVFYLILAAMN